MVPNDFEHKNVKGTECSVGVRSIKCDFLMMFIFHIIIVKWNCLRLPSGYNFKPIVNKINVLVIYCQNKNIAAVLNLLASEVPYPKPSSNPIQASPGTPGIHGFRAQKSPDTKSAIATSRSTWLRNRSASMPPMIQPTIPPASLHPAAKEI